MRITNPEAKLHVKGGGLEIEEQGTGSIDSVPIPEINLRQSRYAYTHTNDRTVRILKFINSGPRYITDGVTPGNNTHASNAQLMTLSAIQGKMEFIVLIWHFM